MPRVDYEERKEARIDRLNERADNARAKSDSLNKEARRMADVIPFGQPILCGHHSERRDRNYRDRFGKKFEKSYEEHNKANHLANRAASAESNAAISSDDPEAIVKLKEKLSDLLKEHALKKAVNSAYRKFKKNSDSLEASGLSDKAKSTVRNFVPEYSWDKGPISSYSLSNGNANIKRVRDRIKVLESEFARAEEGDKSTKYDGFEVLENVDENRVQFLFPGKPSAEVRKVLKSYGFRWSRYNSAWQRQLNSHGVYVAHDVAKRIEGM